MRHLTLQRASKRDGIAATELAILLPFLVFVFIVVIDYCRIFFVTQTVEQAAQVGVLYASDTVPRAPGVNAETATRNAVLADAVSLDPPIAASDISISTAGGVATVTVTYRHRTLTRYLGGASDTVITRQASMAVQPAPGS